jgi:predicted nucleic acid-binding protein
MRTVFADTVYWIATVHPSDPWAASARKARTRLGPARMVTTDEVLTEFLAALSRGGPRLRQQAVKMVRAIMASPQVLVVPQSRESFLRGVDLYEHRLDKEYSLTDCSSMRVMRSEALSEILTNDGHFSQEGFRILMTSRTGREL